MVRRSTCTMDEIKCPRIGLPYIDAGLKTEIVRIVNLAILKVSRRTSSSNRPDKNAPRIDSVVLLRQYSRTITEIVRIVNVYSVTDGQEEYKHNGRD
jgi:hypothetical protein